MNSDRSVREASDELLDIAKPLNACDGRTEGVVVPEVEVHGVFEAFPFLLREEAAELAVSYSDSLKLCEPNPGLMSSVKYLIST